MHIFVISFWHLGGVCYLNTTQPIVTDPKLPQCHTWGRKLIPKWWPSTYINENYLLQGDDLVNVTRLRSGQVNNMHDKKNCKRWSQTSIIREQLDSNWDPTLTWGGQRRQGPWSREMEHPFRGHYVPLIASSSWEKFEGQVSHRLLWWRLHLFLFRLLT